MHIIIISNNRVIILLSAETEKEGKTLNLPGATRIVTDNNSTVEEEMSGWWWWGGVELHKLNTIFNIIIIIITKDRDTNFKNEISMGTEEPL